MKFGLYEKIASLFCQDKNNQKFYEKFISGSIAGMITCTTIYPLDAMKVRLALTPKGVYTGLIDCV